MGMITQDSIAKIMATARIEEVVEDFVNLRRRGVNMLGLCPFHDEKTPSFTVSPAKNIYKCFGCGKGGDPVRFIMDHESLSYPEALRYLAGRYNIELEETENTKEEKEAKVITDSYYILNEFAKDYYHKKLFESQEGKAIGMSYFKERGFSESTIKKFQLGYAISEYDAFVTEASRQKYNLDHLKAIGLSSKSGSDFFRSRVMFTIHNIGGKVIGFGGRTLSSDKKVPKYINSIESEIYNKRKTLYGLFFAKGPIRKADECILVEGYTDVITLHQNGVQNAVASSGTSLTVDQIRLIKRYTPNIKIIFDGDTAGVKAALRGLDMILEEDMNVSLVLLPEGEDPDSTMKQMGLEGFKGYLKEHGEDFIFFKMNLLLGEAGDDPLKRAQVLKDIVSSLAKIPDMLKRTTYTQACSARLNVAEHILVTETNKLVKANLKQQRFAKEREQLQKARSEERIIVDNRTDETPDAPIQISAPKPKGDEYQEKDLLRVLLIEGNELMDQPPETKVAAWILEHCAQFANDWDSTLYFSMFTMAKEQYEKDSNIDLDTFITHSNEQIRSLAIDFMSSPYEYAAWEERGIQFNNQKPPEDNHSKDAMHSVYRFMLKKIERRRAEATKMIEQAKTDPALEAKLPMLLQLLSKLNTRRAEIAGNFGTTLLY